MSIQSEINRINTNISNTYSVLSELGATMPATRNSANLAATVATLPKMVYGTATIAYNSSGSSVSVNFGCTFKAAPAVLTSCVFDDANIVVKNEDISTTGFTAKLAGVFTSSGTRSFKWVAVGAVA